MLDGQEGMASASVESVGRQGVARTGGKASSTSVARSCLSAVGLERQGGDYFCKKHIAANAGHKKLMIHANIAHARLLSPVSFENRGGVDTDARFVAKLFDVFDNGSEPPADDGVIVEPQGIIGNKRMVIPFGGTIGEGKADD